MSNKIEKQISYLNEIADGGIKEDKFHHEFKDISTTLDYIKQEIEKGEGSKEQIKKIIKFLDNQIKTIPNGDFVMTHKLNQYRNDYIQLLQKQEKEKTSIRTSSKKDINKMVDENIAKEEKSKKQINFSEKQKKTFESNLDLNNLSSYTVKSGDNLWNIVKKHYPKFTKTNKDIIHIVNYIVNLNIKLEPQKLKHLMRDDKLAWGKKGSDGIAGDTLRVGDILKLPKIKTIQIKMKKSVKKDIKPDAIQAPKAPTTTKNKTTKDINKQETITANTYTEHYIFKDGRILLVGKDGEKHEFSRELSKEELEKIKSFEKIAILNEILDIWKNEANNVVEGLFWKSARDDDEIINTQINGIEKDFSELYNKIITNKISTTDINKSINKIFNKIQIAEGEENIIGGSDMNKVKETLLSSNLNKNEKLIKIYNLMRYKGLSGNSNTVKEKVSNHLLTTKEFKSISNILNNENLLIYIENNNINELTKLLGNKEISEEILEAYNKIKIKQEKHRDEYSKILEKINKDKKAKGEKEISLNDFIELNVNYSIQTLVKHTLIESKIDSLKDRGEENTYTGLYANISGLARSSLGDVFIIADDNIDTAIDIGTTLAISAISMGIGMLAARGAMAVVNYGTKAANIGKATSRIGSISRFAGTASVEGTSFYMGTNTMNNLIYGNFEGYNIGENNLNIKEISKSIAFMGVLRGVGKVMEGMKNAKFKKSVAGSTSLDKTEINFLKLGKLTEKVPPLMFKNTSITGVLVEAGLLTATSVGLEITFEGEGNWTWEEYMQALVMVGLFRGVSKIKFSKGKNGEIKTETEIKNNTKSEEIFEGASSTPVSFYRNTKTGEIYTKTLDGAFINSKGEVVFKKGIDFIGNKIVDKNFLSNIEKVETINTKTSKKTNNLDKQSNSSEKTESNGKTETTESLTKYENKRFNELLLKEFENKNQITLTNSLGESLMIKKHSSNGKFLIEGKGNPLTKKEMLKKIDESFRLKFINDYNIDMILKLGKDQEFNLLKTLGHPFDGKIQIKEGGKVLLNGKEISNNRVKQLLKIPKVRESILKQKLENMTIDQLLSKVKDLKGFEKLKGLSDGALKMGLERFKALAISGLVGGTLNATLFAILNDKKTNSKTEAFLELLEYFALGAAGGLVLSGIKTGTMIAWGTIKGTGKLGWKVVSIPVSYISKYKKSTIALSVLGISGAYYVFSDSKTNNQQNNP